MLVYSSGGDAKTSDVSDKLRLNLILIAIIAALATFLISTEQKQDGEKKIFISDIAATDIKHISLKRRGKDDINFVKQQDSWMMTSPYFVRASKYRITAMLKLLHEQSFAQFSSKELERFKLNPAKVLLHLNDQEFAFGDSNQIDKHRYVSYRDTVHLINDDLYPQLTQPAKFFISTKLLPDGLRLSRIQYPTHDLKKEFNQWSSGPTANISTETIEKIANAWLGATAMTVSDYQQTKPGDTITIETEQGQSFRFNIITDGPGLILARKDLGIQYQLDGITARQLLQDINLGAD